MDRWKRCLVGFLHNYCPDLPESHVNLIVAEFFKDLDTVPDYPGKVKISSCQWKDFMMRLQLCIKETEAQVAKAQAERKAAERKAAEADIARNTALMQAMKAKQDRIRDRHIAAEAKAIKKMQAWCAKENSLLVKRLRRVESSDWAAQLFAPPEPGDDSDDDCPYVIVSSSDEEEF